MHYPPALRNQRGLPDKVPPMLLQKTLSIMISGTGFALMLKLTLEMGVAVIIMMKAFQNGRSIYSLLRFFGIVSFIGRITS